MDLPLQDMISLGAGMLCGDSFVAVVAAVVRLLDNTYYISDEIVVNKVFSRLAHNTNDNFEKTVVNNALIKIA